MKNHWLLLFSLLFVVSTAFAQTPPRALLGSFDDQTGDVDLMWSVPTSESEWMEDFEDGTADDFGYDNAANWMVSGGLLSGTFTPASSADQWEAASYTGMTWGDGIFEAEMTRTQGTDTFSLGTFVHGTGAYDATYSGYMFNIAPAATGGAFFIAQINSGVVGTVYASWLSADMNLGVGASNNVAIVADGSDYYMFVNGVEVYAFTDFLYTTGEFGVGFADDIGVTGAVDYEYMAYDGGTTVATNMVPQEGGVIGMADAMRLPEGFRGPQTKSQVQGLLYANGVFQGQSQNVTDDFIEFRIYRNGDFLDATTNTNFSTTLPGFGGFDFTVTAFFDEGESDAIGPYSVNWLDPQFVRLNENFDDGLPGDWTVETTIASGTWQLDDGTLPNSRGIFGTPYMLVDSDYPGSGVHLMERLITPEVDVDGATYKEFTYRYYFEEYEMEQMDVEWSVDGGANWNNLATYDATSGPELVTFDVTAALDGQPAVWFSWYYDDLGSWGWFAAVDDVQVYCEGEAGPVTLDLMPTNVNIPVGGGDVVYDASVVSTIGASMNGLRYQTFVTIPNQQVFGPLSNIPWNLTPFMDVTVTGLTQSIPANAPAGDYVFMGVAGVPSNPNLQISDSFNFTKAGAAADGTFEFNAEDWAATGSFIADDAAQTVEMPKEFALQQAYPNPFNPTTNVAVSLPETADLKVTVFNVMGQQVATLANGQVNAGTHNFVFDAANLSSGVYFIQAQVPGQLNAIQKVTLMK
ncbi:T9SS type A sorting domain-containing protein [bacterium]|nr:T9SS type A sorting domain-containing protein [bacterium]